MARKRRMKFTQSPIIAMRHTIFFLLLSLTVPPMYGQAGAEITKVHRQRSFPHTVPAGNYSGITHIGGNLYAVVSDKTPEMGFHLFQVDVDTVTGRLQHVEHLRFLSAGQASEDEEAIAYYPPEQTLFLLSEATGIVREADLNGRLTGRTFIMPDLYRHLSGQYGLESFTYNALTRQFWTCNEGSPVVIQRFDDQLHPVDTFSYPLDPPARNRKAVTYAHGVSELLALDDGSLLVLEREFFVPRRKVGSWVVTKVYHTIPGHEKHLLASWKTRLHLTSRSLANYEGMTLGPQLADGRQVVILVADSQNQYAGVLKDYFKTMIISTP